MNYHPLGSAAIVFENFIIGFMFTTNLVLLVIFSVAMEASEFLVFGLAIEWFTLVMVGLYLLVRESRVRGTPPSLQKALVMFAAHFILDLVTSLALTIRAWPGSTLCDAFGNLANACGIALAVVAMSWLTTTAAFGGILLSYSGPLRHLYLGLRARWIPKENPNEHVIELVNIPSYQPSHNGGKEGWTDIPV